MHEQLLTDAGATETLAFMQEVGTHIYSTHT